MYYSWNVKKSHMLRNWQERKFFFEVFVEHNDMTQNRPIQKEVRLLLDNPELGWPFLQRRDVSIGLPSFLPFQRN